MEKTAHHKAREAKLHDYSCHLDLPSVENVSHRAPLYDSNYYQGFERFPKTVSFSDRFPDDDGLLSYYQEYLEPYFSTSYLYNKDFSETFFPDPTLGKLCKSCKSASACNAKVKKGLTAKLQFDLFINNRAFCVTGKKQHSYLEECRVCRKWYYGLPPSKQRKIHIHDLRFLGHPVVVCVNYAYFRCTPKAEGMRSLPGVYKGSESNPIRFSCRLAKAINTALAENLRLTYISEACAIPRSTINHWKQRELALNAEVHESSAMYMNFLHPYPFLQVSNRLCSIHHQTFVFVFHRSDGIDFLHAIYSKSEWDSLAAIVSGTRWSPPDLSDARFLNLTYDYLSCCTEIPPHIGAMVLVNACDWASSKYSQYANILTNALAYGNHLWDIPEGWSTQRFYQNSWSSFTNFLLNVRGSKKEVLLAVLQSLRSINNDSAAPIPDFKSWYQKTCLEKPIFSTISKTSRAPELFDELSAWIHLSSLSRQEITARLLHFNPIALPHIDSTTVPRQYLFTENGDFDTTYNCQTQIPLPELLQMLQAGLLRDDSTVPIQLMSNH